jgi:hypothetical protein
MSKIKQLIVTILVVCLACVFGTTQAAAERVAEQVKYPVADVNIGPNGIDWMPKVEYGQLLLTVSRPDGEVFNKTFTPGTTPYFELAGQFPDGAYTYELQAAPVMTEKRVRENINIAGMKHPLIQPLTQTGYFQVIGGKIVTPAAAETGIARPMDEVINDDLIVDGSLCVGNDCYSGYAFGFDTIVLMENNLRIYFDDTSNTSSFPNNDWRIVINDTTDGGGAYFAIQDTSGGKTPFTIEADAKTNSLYVDDDGQVGIGTSGPVFELHIREGDTPTVRLHQDTAYGWPEQIWDVGGNETSFFIRDGTHAARLPFRIEPETPSSTLCLKSDGKVGIGTWSPAYLLELEATGETAVFALQRTDGATAKIVGGASAVQFGSISNHNVKIITNDSDTVAIFETTGDVGIGLDNPSYKLEIYNSGGSNAYCDGGAWVNGSSRAGKENIHNLTTDNAMDTLQGLTPVRFNYKGNEEEEYLGFIAEDVPELVATKDRNGMSPMDVVAVLTKVVQEQQETISKLNKRITELEKKSQ